MGQNATSLTVRSKPHKLFSKMTLPSLALLNWPALLMNVYFWKIPRNSCGLPCILTSIARNLGLRRFFFLWTRSHYRILLLGKTSQFLLSLRLVECFSFLWLGWKMVPQKACVKIPKRLTVKTVVTSLGAQDQLPSDFATKAPKILSSSYMM